MLSTAARHGSLYDGSAVWEDYQYVIPSRKERGFWLAPVTRLRAGILGLTKALARELAGYGVTTEAAPGDYRDRHSISVPPVQPKTHQEHSPG